MRRFTPILFSLVFLAGCPVMQRQDTPVDARRLSEPESGRDYWLYVPSHYDASRSWPLVITLHGTHGWDSSRAQIQEWKYLAEQGGFLVAAPSLDSPQGITPVLRDLWYRDIEADEEAILRLLEHLRAEYNIAEDQVLLTGFSAGGYPLYYTGLRNPDRFDMLIARACNSDIDLFERIELTDEARRMPIVIFWGRDDLKPLRDQSWEAFRYLRERGFVNTSRRQTRGGHIRRPELAWDIWLERLQERDDQQ